MVLPFTMNDDAIKKQIWEYAQSGWAEAGPGLTILDAAKWGKPESILFGSLDELRRRHWPIIEWVAAFARSKGNNLVLVYVFNDPQTSAPNLYCMNAELSVTDIFEKMMTEQGEYSKELEKKNVERERKRQKKMEEWSAPIGG